MEEYENYPYKRLYATATAYGYPLTVIEELMDYLIDGLPRPHYKRDAENLLKMLLVHLNYYLDYSFDSKEGLDKCIEEFVKVKESRHTRIGMLARAIEGF